MDRIEAMVRMPRGAQPLAAYARFYAAVDGGRISGVYLVPSGPMPADWGCSEMTPEGESREVRCDPSVMRGDGVRAGERRWVEADRLPAVDDGGCGIVTLEFDTQAGRIINIECNGEA